ncbi:MAG TPA: response regulator [Bacteroidia bacterium]|nr:response regulator [Bacteroidia bacterium]HRS57832.1 response regulator [Bacteroidia bacterium]HRU69395.1 response regulator [Bacteroidia bacterium]
MVGEMSQETQKPALILFAEDEYYNYLVVYKMLKYLNVEVIHVENGAEAVRVFKENPDIRLVLMDIKMSGMNGLDATREIKKIRPEVPVIAVTAYALSGDREDILAAGCNDYLAKPIKMEELHEMVNKFLQAPV